MSTESTPKLSDGTSAAEILKQTVEHLQAEQDKRIAELVAKFDSMLRDGGIQVSEHNTESIVLCWMPPIKQWNTVLSVSAALKALSEKSDMITKWNGCNSCPITFHPRPKTVTRPEILTKEALKQGIKGMLSLFAAVQTKQEPSDEALDNLASFIHDRYTTLTTPCISDGSGQYCISGGELSGEPCMHRAQYHPVTSRFMM